MKAEDLDQVLALESETPEAPHWDRAAYSKLLLTDLTGVRYGAFVAVNGVELAGFIVVRQVLEICEIESIVVAPGARRQRTGTGLLEEALHWAAAGGAERIRLEVRAGNRVAIHFYEEAGLLKEGLRQGYYRDPEDDAILLGKGLYSSD
jgi:ribosomal-protein-alanine N-acetyltransferase